MSCNCVLTPSIVYKVKVTNGKDNDDKSYFVLFGTPLKKDITIISNLFEMKHPRKIQKSLMHVVVESIRTLAIKWRIF